MALGITKATFTATVLGVSGEPPALHWRKLGGSEGGQRRALGGAEYLLDAELLAAARDLPSGTEVQLTTVTDWSKSEMRTHLEAFQVLSAPVQAAA